MWMSREFCRRGRRALVLSCLLFGCSESTTPIADAGTKTDGPGHSDGASGDATGVGDGPVGDGSGQQGKLPAVPPQSGVVYVAHFLDTELRIYRTDGSEPKAEKTFALGTDGNVHDMVLDPYNDRLFIAQDLKKRVVIYQLTRPSGAGQPVADPVELAAAAMDHPPRFLQVDPQHQRLYAFASPPPPASGPIKNFLLYIFDIGTPASPTQVTGSPFEVPVTTSMAVDGPRQALFLVEGTTNKLYGYDLAGDKVTPLAGDPIELATIYPQTQTSTALQFRSLTADPFRNRLYSARNQGGLSELVVLEYGAAIPPSGSRYGDLAGLVDVKKVAGPFDVDKPLDQRPNILQAYVPTIDLQRGDVFMSADAWNGTSATAMIVAAKAGTGLAGGCDAFEGFGCWVRQHSGGSAGVQLQTDGATCVDYVNRVVVGTSYDSGDQQNPGAIHFYRVKNDNLEMGHWLPSSGDTLIAGALPIAAVCH